VLLPLIIILPHFWGVTGVWIANPIADVVAAVVSFFFFRRELRKLSCPADTPADVPPPEPQTAGEIY